MLIGMAWKMLVTLTAISLIVYALTPNASLGYLLKLFALNWGIVIISLFAWPHIRGVRRGDPLVIKSQPSMKVFGMVLSFPAAIALSNGRLNEFIEVKFIDGSTGIGKITKYQGLLSNAEVEIMAQNQPELKIEINSKE